MATAHYDLLILGAGSGNMLPGDATADWSIAIVESDRFGGTCLNRGCIPSKMFVHTADVAETVRHAARFGVQASIDRVDWPAIRDRVFGRIDPIHQSAVSYRRSQGVDVHLGAARFVAPRTVEVEGDILSADRVLVAVGSRPILPDIPGLEEVGFHTSDTIMRLDRLPASMLVIGGGYIAAEMSHVFGGLGTGITIVSRSERLIGTQDVDVSERFTQIYEDRFDVVSPATVASLERSGERISAVLDTPGGPERREVDTVLVATGRRPNSDLLDVEAGGMAVDEHGHVVTDGTYLTGADSTWSIGDVTNHFQLKHMANAETRLVLNNMLHPAKPRQSAFDRAPSAVFADPQVATVGVTEQEVRASGRPYITNTREYSSTAYGWALEDSTSFAKVIADPETRLLLGAHVLGPQAATLIQPLVQGIALGNTLDQLARDVIYLHPALTEVIENVLLDL